MGLFFIGGFPTYVGGDLLLAGNPFLDSNHLWSCGPRHTLLQSESCGKCVKLTKAHGCLVRPPLFF